MPKIRIFETDSTGITSSDVAIVFVPGNAALKENVADANGCVYIPSTYSSKVGTEDDKYFTQTLDAIQEEYVDGSDINVIHLIKLLTLALLVLRVSRANNHYTSMTLYDLAVLAHPLD